MEKPEKIEKKIDPVKGVIFVDKQSILFYFEKAKGVYKIDLKPEVVFDLEVVNEDLLSQTLDQFITTNIIPPLTAIVVLSPNVLFTKDISRIKDNKEISEEEYEEAIKRFTDNVPFEDPEEKRYPLSKTSERIVVINMNYIDTLKHILSLHHISIQSVHTPFDKELGGFTNGYSDSAMKNALGKIGSVKTASVTVAEKTEAKESAEKNDENYEIQDQSPSNKKMTPATIRLLAIFGVLILILVGVSVKTFVLDADDVPLTPTPTPDPSTQTGSTPSPTTPVPQIVDKSTIRIQVINATGITNEAAKVSDILGTEGFSRITMSNTSPSEGVNTRIVFKSSVSSQIKTEIQGIISSLGLTVTTIETPDLSSDVIITLYEPITTTPAIQPQN